MNQPDLLPEHCRDRQRRLLEVIQRERLDLVIVTRTEHVQWLAGTRFRWFFEPAAALSADGKLTLVAPNREPEAAAADRVVTYQAQRTSTLRNDQREACAAALIDALGPAAGAKRIGVEFASFGPHLATRTSAELVDIEPDLFRLRRRKHPDELALVRHAISATEAMYRAARDIIAPGVSELQVFNHLQAAAVNACGEMLSGTGNDYASGERGGPPRARKIEAGELYILDLGPAYRGYFADNCRTIAVDSPATDEQLAAWERIVAVFDLVEKRSRAGASCRELFQDVHELLNGKTDAVFNHHLGHGIGLFPHEAPHLNPDWDDVFEVGDVFTAEPGLYSPSLRAGIRLENNYLVTEEGVELLTDFPLELAT